MSRCLFSIALALTFLPSVVLGAEFSTLAGSGAAGVSDGPANSASFLLPDGVAVAQNGTIYITDYLAQNIRAISMNGTVSTLAGGGDFIDHGLAVRGGYHDGPVHAARFNGPRGIAVDKAGRIFIADTNNKCIRIIENGVVRTFAGSPTKKPGDGTTGTAGFFEPRALAFDDNGVLWVGDAMMGLRRIAPSGVVTTTQLPKTPIETPEYFASHITSIAPNGPRLMLSDGVSLLDFNPNNADDYAFTIPDIPNTPMPDHAWHQSNRAPAGYAFGVTYLDKDIFIYTDPVLHAVRLHRNSLNYPLSVRPAENDDFLGGDLANGDQGLVDSPLGIASYDNDSVVFADSGNRRIRMIRKIDKRHFSQTIVNPFGQYSDASSYYRVLVVGNSMLAHAVPFSATAGARLESLLNAHHAAIGLHKPAKVALVWLGTSAQVRDYVQNIASSNLADAVIFDFNTSFVNFDIPGNLQFASPVNNTHIWKRELTEKIQSIRRTLHDAGIPFYAAIQPSPHDFPPIEEMASRMTYPGSAGNPEEYQGDEQLFSALFHDEGKRLIDLWPIFVTSELQAERRPLFGTRDHHLSVWGQHVVGDAFYNALSMDHPWSSGDSVKLKKEKP